jgi:hypothetical protein
MPSPPDAMLDAVRDAVIGFFPSGRALHVREVLAKFDQMAAKVDAIAESKMAQVMANPKVMSAIDKKADRLIETAIGKIMTDQSAGT